MSLLILMRTLVGRVWFTFTRHDQRNDEPAQLLQYHPWLFGRTKDLVELERRSFNIKW